MFCTNCGTQNDDNAYKCIKCGQIIKRTPTQPIGNRNIPNYLVHSIFVTLLCCLPLGVVAIIYAAQVNGKIQAGDLKGARYYSDKAKLFCWISFGIGLGFTLVWVILNFVIGVGMNM